MRRKWLQLTILFLVVVLVVGGGGYWLNKNKGEKGILVMDEVEIVKNEEMPYNERISKESELTNDEQNIDISNWELYQNRKIGYEVWFPFDFYGWIEYSQLKIPLGKIQNEIPEESSLHLKNDNNQQILIDIYGLSEYDKYKKSASIEEIYISDNSAEFIEIKPNFWVTKIDPKIKIKSNILSFEFYNIERDMIFSILDTFKLKK